MQGPTLKETLENLQEHEAAAGKILVVDPELVAELREHSKGFALSDEVLKNGLVGQLAPEERKLKVKCRCGYSICWLEIPLASGHTKYISANPPGVAIARFTDLVKGSA